MPTTPEDSPSSSALHIHPSLLGSGAVRSVFGESRMRGSLITTQEIQRRVESIDAMAELAQSVGGYKPLLSGESSVSDAPAGQMHIPDKSMLNSIGLLDRTFLTFGAALGGPDYAGLQRNRPAERYKFYSSLDLTNPSKVNLGAAWFKEVAIRAHEQGLSLTTKTFDHAYDSLNLYTWDPVQLSSILADLYPTYSRLGLYLDTPHFFQGELEGVNPSHVGYVQEPVSGYVGVGGGQSHSTRMGILGGVLDGYVAAGELISPEVFTEAAAVAGVNPARPFLLAK